MTKDIEWMKEEIGELPCVDTVFNSDGSSYIDSAVPVMAVYDLLDQLDEPEVLSQEFINEKAVEVYADTADAEVHVVFRMRDLQNLLVPKQELPVIPKFVAEWYESEGKRNSWWNWFYKWGRDESRTELESKTIGWMQDFNEELFVDIFRYGYEVEKEQKYYVLDSEEIPLLERANNQTCKTTTGLSIYEDGRDNSRFELTEQEIKDYDKRFWPFTVKVEELEE